MKLEELYGKGLQFPSPPVRGRGLKLVRLRTLTIVTCRPPCGGVD